MTVENEPDTDPAEEPTNETEDQSPEQDDEHQDDAETFPRSVVVKLRTDVAKYRTRAKDAEALAEERGRALFTARIAATGKLADPEDLPYDAELVTDDDKLTAAIDELVSRKPHLATRKPSGSVGQGVTGNNEPKFSLMGRLQQNA